ncbi:MAG: alpha/beta hydrolase [Bauldia litoralis]
MRAPAYKKAGQGDRTVLFLHGIGGNQQSFDTQLAALPDGWRGLAWDMPGYGGSDPLPAMTFESLAASAIALLDDADAGTAVILGHSMGGMIAQEIAMRHPDRVAGLVLFATTPAFGGRDDSFKQRFLADRLAPLDAGKTPADIAPSLVGGMFGPATPEPVKALAAASMAAIPASAYRAALECIVTFDRRANLDRIACPTLVLAAEDDTLSPPKTMEKMAGRIPGAVYRCLAGVGHLANFEDPAAFNAVLTDFLKSLD